MTPHPINRIDINEPVTIQNLTVFPITQPESSGPDYIASSVAIDDHGLVITEVDSGGSVPNLAVENPSDHRVLLLDGEELRGAKQNRIVNATLLLAPRSKTVINVSCTEMGRWSYNSATFSHSKSVMSAKARRRKTRSVSNSLEAAQSFQSDQMGVWDDVAELHQKVGSHSNTSAMADAYEKMRSELDTAIRSVPVVENQCGLLAMIDGKPAGLDIVSQGEVYSVLHAQLIQSYAMEAMADLRARVFASSRVKPLSEPSVPDVMAAKAFLERCAAIEGKSYNSVALGSDWRFANGAVFGSGLEYQDTWIHMAYFMEDPEDGGNRYHRGRIVRMSRRGRGHGHIGPMEDS